ncbi:DUF559 domain-containing protein [Nocardioides sp. GY 10127]|uniref:DUF559 domain-containing protein n=1 Tax=Nocardioides sp. GY 10127 TaxID=2569762 RepID=UPI0010A86ADE|nr:DUF559 domain-containing protein [Nocardioides sp. GY 10127]TIC84480.1 DUF559 domain-containing protein [Nocardioides sp. GY 10127]
MPVTEELERLGGVAPWARLVALVGRAEAERARDAGDVVRVARGRYALPGAGAARVEAMRLTGAASHLSAALLHGWEVHRPQPTPVVTVERHRSLRGLDRRGTQVRWAPLSPRELADGLTSPERTLLDCLRTLPFDEALCVADSALRAGLAPERLTAGAAAARGPGSAAARRVAAAADARAANPFESTLRALVLDVPGLTVVPQVPICAPRWLGRPDLVDARLRMVLEADSFAFHGDRAALARDARRYNDLVVHGWLVLRFSWEEVMLHPARVTDVVRRAVELRTAR